MSKNEDYLDSLLTSVTDKLNEFDSDFEKKQESLRESYRTQSSLPSKTQRALDDVRGDNFLKEFESELAADTEEDFIREFERELDGDADEYFGGSDESTDSYVNQMDELMSAADQGGFADDDQLEVDTLTSDPDLEDIFNSQEESPLPLSAEDEEELPLPTEDGEEGPAQLYDADQELNLDMDTPTSEQEEESIAAPPGMEGLEDLFGQEPEPEPQDSTPDVFVDEIPEPLIEGEEPAAPKAESNEGLIDGAFDASLEDILNESDDEALSEIGKMLDNSDADTSDNDTIELQAEGGDIFPGGPDFGYDESVANGEEGKKGRKKKERDPNSFFSKLARLLFGTPEELDPDAVAENGSLGGISDENKEVMAEADADAAKQNAKQQKALKKQQKKEEKELKKKEKEAAKAEKAAKKEAKPKKEKKPKEKGPKEPALPKVPVAMMWGIALSILLLVLLGSSVVGYSSAISQAKDDFNDGDYVAAYGTLQGVSIKEVDQELYHKVVALAGIQTQLDAYTSLMEQKQYELALDALIRGIGRCEVHSAEAEEWGVSEELLAMQKQFSRLLREQFDLSKRRAKKLYKIKKRSEYTVELHKILDELGLY